MLSENGMKTAVKYRTILETVDFELARLKEMASNYFFFQMRRSGDPLEQQEGVGKQNW